MTSTAQQTAPRQQHPPRVLVALLLAAVALGVLGMHVFSVGHQLITADHDPAAHHTSSTGAAVSAGAVAAHHDPGVTNATGGHSGPEGCLTCCTSGDMLLSGCLLALALVAGWVLLRLTRSGPTPPWLSCLTSRRPPRAVPILGPQLLRQPAWTLQELCISRI